MCPAGTVSVTTARARCLIATVEPVPSDYDNGKPLPDGDHVQVGNTPTHVVAKDRLAWRELGRGYVAVVVGSIGMSPADLALAAASVRMDPAVHAAPVAPAASPAQPSGLAPSSAWTGTETAVPQSR